jgi:outer membrane lipoprotein-sorting protein
MAELHEQESEFSRLLQELPFDDAPRPEHAEHLRQQALAEFDQAGQAVPATRLWKQALNQGRELMRRPIPRLIVGAAACVALLAAWMLLPGRQSTAQAFSRFAEAVIQAKTARFQMEMTVEGQPKQKFQTLYLAPGKYRQEMGAVVNVSDFTTGKIASLMPTEKKAQIMNITGLPKNKLSDPNKPADVIGGLRTVLSGSRDAKESQFERLGEKEIDGKRAVGFRFDTPAATTTLWGDSKTGMPVRIENVWRGIPRTEVVMSNFEIDVPLEESLFDLTPPAGFKVLSLDVDASEPREQDLVLAFQACSNLGGGEFPESLDTAGINKMVLKYAKSQGKEMSDDKSQQMMKEILRFGRGLQFILQLPESADAHYAGKGIRRGAKDKPIFWYKPAGAKQFRVLDADLTLHDAESAPQVAGAQRIDRSSKTKNPAEK